MVQIREAHPRTCEGKIDLAKWLERLSGDWSNEERALIEKASLLAQKWGENEPTEYGVSCLQQGLTMAEILADLNLDHETLLAALLFNSVQDAGLTLKEINDTFGGKAADLVQGVCRMAAMRNFHGRVRAGDLADQGQMDSLRRMLLAMVEDVRVVLIKLAEQTCVLRAAADLDDDLRRRVANAVRDIYAPLSNRLGVGQIKWEMEDFAFRFLQPESYKRIAQLLDEKRIDREQHIKRVVAQLQSSLADDHIDAEVKGRVKHIYSIWRKMQRKGINYDEIYDVRAVRILVSEVKECYSALGTVHRLWPHIPKEFDDYIAMPKENGYRSLHTAVIGPEGKTLEVQIRTQQMHQESELGVAAHWRYKEGVRHDPGYENKIAWLRQLLDWQAEVADADEVVASISAEAFEDRVYVLTPAGKVIELPEGATPIDFAYRVHTEVGHRCRGAKVNGHIVPLTYKLKTGEQLEILTTSQGGPSRDWLNPYLGYLTSSRARSKVHAWFKHQDFEKNFAEGRAILDRELPRLGVNQLDYAIAADKLNFKTREDVMAAVGRGDLRVSQVLHAAGVRLKQEEVDDETALLSRGHPVQRGTGDVVVSGVGNLLTVMAKCCQPVPGDPIIGFITQGRGVSIHKKDCNNILDAQSNRAERLIEVQWGGDDKARVYPVDISINAYDRQGLLRDVTALLSNEGAMVTAMSTSVNRREHTVHTLLTVEITGLDLLGRLLDRLNQLPNIIEARRKV